MLAMVAFRARNHTQADRVSWGVHRWASMRHSKNRRRGDQSFRSIRILCENHCVESEQALLFLSPWRSALFVAHFSCVRKRVASSLALVLLPHMQTACSSGGLVSSVTCRSERSSRYCQGCRLMMVWLKRSTPSK